MSASGIDVKAPPVYSVRTHNTHATSENRMHSDDVAARYGFKGALVPGVTVFSHMTHPLVVKYGVDWLGHGQADVTFAKPAYDDELLAIHCLPASTPKSYALTCVNEQCVELARMSAQLFELPFTVDARASIAPALPREKQLVNWDLMEVGVPFPALTWTPTAADNLKWCADVRDELAIYRDGPAPPLHPGFILRQANLVLRNRFSLPAWIHTGSRITFHDIACCDDTYEVRAVPEEKWRSSGHEFVRLYVCMMRDAQVVTEIMHTAIFQPRQVVT
jgi:hypothetical protein